MEAEKKIKAHHNTSGSDEEDFNETEAEKTTEVMQNVEKRKSFLLSQIASSHSALSSIRYITFWMELHHFMLTFHTAVAKN